MSKPKSHLDEQNSLEFDTYFGRIYGDDWPRIRVSFKDPSQPVPFMFPGGNKPYFLDKASILAAQLLPIQPDSQILDLCAAPGGKTLVMAAKLGEHGGLIANELSLQRRLRLRRVIEEHVPLARQAQIRITGHDASRWCLYQKNMYDAILLDAPCSSERHLVSQSEEKQWSQNRSKALAIRQYAMLASALEALKVGGFILYSTCSISPMENDGVIDKLLKKRGELVRIKPISLEIGQATKNGWIILPHTTGHGPLFFCLIEKTRLP